MVNPQGVIKEEWHCHCCSGFTQPCGNHIFRLSPFSSLCVLWSRRGELQCGNGAESKTWPLWFFSTPHVCLWWGFSLCYVSFLWSKMLTWPVMTVHLRIFCSFPLVRKFYLLRIILPIRGSYDTSGRPTYSCNVIFCSKTFYIQRHHSLQWHDYKHGQKFVLIALFKGFKGILSQQMSDKCCYVTFIGVEVEKYLSVSKCPWDTYLSLVMLHHALLSLTDCIN